MLRCSGLANRYLGGQSRGGLLGIRSDVLAMCVYVRCVMPGLEVKSRAGKSRIKLVAATVEYVIR